MRRVIVGAAFVLAAALVLVGWNRFDVSERLALAQHRSDYDLAARWVLQTTRPAAGGELLTVPLPSEWARLSTTGVAWRARASGSDIVYFELNPDLVAARGVMYCPSGQAPEGLAGVSAGSPLGGDWRLGFIDPNVMDSGHAP